MGFHLHLRVSSTLFHVFSPLPFSIPLFLPHPRGHCLHYDSSRLKASAAVPLFLFNTLRLMSHKDCPFLSVPVQSFHTPFSCLLLFKDPPTSLPLHFLLFSFFLSPPRRFMLYFGLCRWGAITFVLDTTGVRLLQIPTETLALTQFIFVCTRSHHY